LRHQAEVRDLGRDKQAGAGVLAGGNTRAAANALRGVHGHLGVILRHGNGVRVRRTAGADTDKPARLLNAIKGLAIYDKVLDERKGSSPKRFDADDFAVLETAHIGLA